MDYFTLPIVERESYQVQPLQCLHCGGVLLSNLGGEFGGEFLQTIARQARFCRIQRVRRAAFSSQNPKRVKPRCELQGAFLPGNRWSGSDSSDSRRIVSDRWRDDMHADGGKPDMSLKIPPQNYRVAPTEEGLARHSFHIQAGNLKSVPLNRSYVSQRNLCIPFVL